MSAVGNAPAIFMDSHPEEQDGYLKSWVTSIRTNLVIAATGKVERFQQPGELRLKWFTYDGNVGFKDFALNQYEQARNEYHAVLALPEVRRAMVLGYPAQNPYILIGGTNPWIERFEREKIQKKEVLREQRAREEKVISQGGEFLNIDKLVRETEMEEANRIRQELEEEAKRIHEAIQKRQSSIKERHADEEEGLLSGHT